MSIYQRVTDAILAQLETADADAWICPWHNSMSGIPVNAVTGRRYRGINVISCWAAARTAGYGDRRWASYRQWTQIGGQVRKGEKGTLCVFYKVLEYGDHNRFGSQNGSTDDEDGPRFVLRFSTIFNAGQVDGVEPERIATPRSFDIAPVAAIESLIEQSGAIIREDVQASYEPRRVDRRLQSLRRWSHDKQDNEQVFSRGPCPRGAAGSGSRRRAHLAVGGGVVDRRQDRLHGADVA